MITIHRGYGKRAGSLTGLDLLCGRIVRACAHSLVDRFEMPFT